MKSETSIQQAREVQALRARLSILQLKLNDALGRVDTLWTENAELRKRLRQLGQL